MQWTRQLTAGAAAGVLLAVVAGAGAGAPSASAVVGGERVATADAPWAVSLQNPYTGRDGKERTRHFCSATVIGPRKVLSARHCFEQLDSWATRVVVGTDAPVTVPGRKVAAARIWLQKPLDYDLAELDRGADIAVVETTADLGVPALPLAAPGSTLPGGTSVWPYGFGHTKVSDYDIEEPALLRRAEMRLYTASQCSETDAAAEPWVLCAGRFDGPLSGVLAPGDSGGGLLHLGAAGAEVVGVNISGTYGPLQNRLSGFTSVAQLRGFVDDPKSGVELPRPTARPAVRGRPRVGSRLRCAVSFTGSAKRVSVSWTTIGGRRSRTYSSGPKGLKVPKSARGRRLVCQATATVVADTESQSLPSRPTGTIR